MILRRIFRAYERARGGIGRRYWNHRGQLRGTVSKRSPFIYNIYYYYLLLLNTRSFAHILIKYDSVSHMRVCVCVAYCPVTVTAAVAAVVIGGIKRDVIIYYRQ